MKKQKASGAEKTLLMEIHRVQDAIDAARDAFSECAHPLLLEATTYELKYLQAKHNYLLDLARQADCRGLYGFR